MTDPHDDESRRGGAQRRIDPARRVRVTAPLTNAALAPRAPSLSREVAEQSELGAIVLRSLLRAQLRLAAIVAGAFLAAVGSLWAISEIAGELPWLPGLPLAWLLTGVLPYPAAVLAGVAYFRAAGRNERRYAELLEEHR